MSHSSYEKKCMFFVGGDDYNYNSPTGQALAGGCTKAWWDSQPNIDTVAGKQTAMGKLMGSDGEPIVTVSTTAHSLYDIGGTNYVKVTDTVGTAFANVEVGMCVYHPDSSWMFDGEAGVFEIREVGGSGAGNTYIVLDTTWQFEGYPAGNDGDTVLVGGAWSDLNTLCGSNILSTNYTQEVWVNKHLTPSAQWDISTWTGSADMNTWLHITGFHRVPGDMTEKDGTYYSHIKNYYDLGVDNFTLIGINATTCANDLFDPSYTENITFKGFNFNNFASSKNLFKDGSVDCRNLVFEHCAYEARANMQGDTILGIVFLDCYLYQYPSANAQILANQAGGSMFAINCWFKHRTVALSVVAAGNITIIGCMGDLEDGLIGLTGAFDGVLFCMNNTWLNFSDTTYGIYRPNQDGTVYALNELAYNKVKEASVFSIGNTGGSCLIKNLNAFSATGAIDDITVIETTHREHEIDELVEVDPELDSSYEPLNESVRTGGIADILGDATSIGAIKTMNLTVINTAVTSAVASIKSKTDNLPADPAGVSDLASVDTSAVKLAADGLDNVVVAEPTGDPSTWSFIKCLRWLIMRFMNKHSSDNFTGIVVHNADGSVSTEQAVTEVSGVKAVSKVTL